MGDISLTGGTVIGLLVALLALSVAIVFVYRNYIKKQQDADLSAKYDDGTIENYLISRNKYPEANE